MRKCIYVKLLLITMALFFLGCSGHRAVAPTVSAKPVLMLEGNESRQLIVAGVGWEAWTAVDAATGYQLCLVDHQIEADPKVIARAYEEAPPWRRMSARVRFDLFSMAVLVNGGDARLAEPECTVSWIIGTNPLIIARSSRSEVTRLGWGGQVGKVAVIGGTLHFATSEDLDEQITELRVLDEWPPTPPSFRPDSVYRESLAQALGKSFEQKVRTIKPPAGTKLREILSDPSWRHRSPISAAHRPSQPAK